MKSTKYIFILIIISLFFLIPQLNDNCIYDETIWFHASVKGIIKTGIPKMYCGEEFQFIFSDHPPGYNYLVSIFPLFLGINNISLHLFNLFNGIFLIITIFYFLNYFFNNYLKSFLSTILILVNPYFQNTIMLLDPDTSTLPLFSILTIYFIIIKKFKKAFISLTLLTFMKLTQPILILPCILFIEYFNSKKIFMTIKTIFKLYFRAFSIHLIIIFLYSIFANINPFSNFIYILKTTNNNFSQNSMFKIIISEFQRFFVLSNPYSLLIILISIFIYILYIEKNLYKNKLIIGIFITTLPTFIIYTTRFVYYPKYYLPSFILICIFSFFILIQKIKLKKNIFYLFLTLLLFLYFSQFKDIIYNSPYTNLSLKKIHLFNDISLFYYFLPLMILFIYLKKMNRTLVALIIYFSACSIENIFMLNADYSVKYFYGITGYNKTINYLKKAKDLEIMCQSDIGIILNKKFYNINCFNINKDTIKYICKNRYLYPNKSLSKKHLYIIKKKGFKKIVTFGDFDIYKKIKTSKNK